MLVEEIVRALEGARRLPKTKCAALAVLPVKLSPSHVRSLQR